MDFNDPIFLRNLQEAIRNASEGIRMAHHEPPRSEDFKVRKFKGESDPTRYLDWEREIENVLKSKGLDDKKSCKFAILRLGGSASLWFEGLKAKRSRERKEKITSWETLKRKLRKQYVPRTYQPIPDQKLGRLGEEGVEELKEQKGYDPPLKFKVENKHVGASSKSTNIDPCLKTELKDEEEKVFVYRAEFHYDPEVDIDNMSLSNSGSEKEEGDSCPSYNTDEKEEFAEKIDSVIGSQGVEGVIVEPFKIQTTPSSITNYSWVQKEEAQVLIEEQKLVETRLIRYGEKGVKVLIKNKRVRSKSKERMKQREKFSESYSRLITLLLGSRKSKRKKRCELQFGQQGVQLAKGSEEIEGVRALRRADRTARGIQSFGLRYQKGWSKSPLRDLPRTAQRMVRNKLGQQKEQSEESKPAKRRAKVRLKRTSRNAKRTARKGRGSEFLKPRGCPMKPHNGLVPTSRVTKHKVR